LIRTPRLILRDWRDSDLAPFAALNADPYVMRFMRGVLTPGESDAYVARVRAHIACYGFGQWAVEAPGVADFIGAVGLMWMPFEASFTPAVEVAWRLHQPYWGNGYATEAARAAVEDGFARLGLRQIVAITALPNVPSQRVMQRLGMQRSLEFDHPLLEQGHALRRHVLYRIGPCGGMPGTSAASA
jgi:RimJ/RimL family protein N-acetyltransferase